MVKIKSKKGFTLVELCIVIALVAVVGTLTTSLIITFVNRSNTILTASAPIQDISGIYRSIDGWVEKYDNIDCVFSATDKKVTIQSGGVEKAFLDASTAGKLIIKTDDETVTKTYDCVKAVSFSLKTETNKNALLRVTITYSDGKNEDLQQLLIFSTHSTKTGRDRISNPDKN